MGRKINHPLFKLSESQKPEEGKQTRSCASRKDGKLIWSQQSFVTAYRPSRFSINLINHKAEELQCDGYLVSILLIPSHSDLTENEKANLALKNKAQEKGKKLNDAELTYIY